MKETKLKLIEYILHEASNQQLEGLNQLLLKNDINYGLENILGGRSFDMYIKTQAEDIYSDDLTSILSLLEDGHFTEAEKSLKKLLNIKYGN